MTLWALHRCVAFAVLVQALGHETRANFMRSHGSGVRKSAPHRQHVAGGSHAIAHRHVAGNNPPAADRGGSHDAAHGSVMDHGHATARHDMQDRSHVAAHHGAKGGTHAAAQHGAQGSQNHVALHQAAKGGGQSAVHHGVNGVGHVATRGPVNGRGHVAAHLAARSNGHVPAHTTSKGTSHVAAQHEAGGGRHHGTRHQVMAVRPDGGSFLEVSRSSATVKQEASQALQRASAASEAVRKATEAAERAQQVALEAKKVAQEAQEAVRKANQAAEDAAEDAEDAVRSMDAKGQARAPHAAQAAEAPGQTTSSQDEVHSSGIDAKGEGEATAAADQVHAIPLNLLFTHKVNLLAMSDDDLADDPEAKVLRKNLQHTVQSFPELNPDNVHFWDDSDCQEGIRSLRILDAFQLTMDFVEEGVGKIKSDLCRLAMLYKFGGYYFDTDILPVVDLQRYISADTTFATVLAHDKRNYFQAFVAATRSHPVIGTALNEFKKWYEELWSPTQDKEQLRQWTAGGDVGTALLRRAYRRWSRKAAEKHRVVHFGTRHVSQFFEEAPLASLQSQHVSNYGVELMGTSGGQCDYGVVDNSTSTLVMYSRVYDSRNNRPCREELYMLLQSELHRPNMV